MRDHFSRGFIFTNNKILKISRELIFAVALHVMFMSSMKIAGKHKFLQNYQRRSN